MRQPSEFEGITCDGEILRDGFIQLPTKILLDDRLSPGAKVSYCILRWYSFKCQRYPGHEQASIDFGIPERSLRRYLGELIAIGHVRRLRHGRGHPNSYHLPQPQLLPYDDAQEVALAVETFVREP